MPPLRQRQQVGHIKMPTDPATQPPGHFRMPNRGQFDLPNPGRTSVSIFVMPVRLGRPRAVFASRLSCVVGC